MHEYDYGMNDALIRMRLMVLIVLATLSGGVWLLQSTAQAENNSQYLTVTFLDVGQGDSIFIETSDGVQVLIDGGPGSGVLRNLGEVMGVRDRTIDMIIGTHPDKDHIGGLVDVLERYEVATILTTENESGSAVASTYRSRIKNEGAEVTYARRGQEFALGASTTLRVLFPDLDPSDMESNSSSIVLQLMHGEIEFILTGDSPKGIEEYLVLLEGEHLKSEVLKIGHHGSRTSTSELFLNEVNPMFAVISAERDSRYGHPHVEVTDMLFNASVVTLSTAESGDITFVSDGAEVWVE
ncbi:MAG: competence protein ComEC [Candidatus Azotimanducaceae bacterium]